MVCTHNPVSETLARVLDAIAAQDLDEAEWELLVVDNNSSPPANERPCMIGREVRIVTESELGLARARECGVRNSKGSIVVFVDDDNVLEPDYLSNASTVFEDPRIGLVSGAIMPEYEEPPAAWVTRFERMLAIRRLASDEVHLTETPSNGMYFPIGAGMAVRRAVIESYYRSIAAGATYVPGRLGSQLSSGEDIDLGLFAISENWLVGTVGSMKLRHVIPPNRTTVEYLSRLSSSSVQSAAEVNMKWSATFGGDVIGGFSQSKWLLYAKCTVARSLSWNPKFRIRYHRNRAVLDIRKFRKGGPK